MGIVYCYQFLLCHSHRYCLLLHCSHGYCLCYVAAIDIVYCYITAAIDIIYCYVLAPLAEFADILTVWLCGKSYICKPSTKFFIESIIF